VSLHHGLRIKIQRFSLQKGCTKPLVRALLAPVALGRAADPFVSHTRSSANVFSYYSFWRLSGTPAPGAADALRYRLKSQKGKTLPLRARLLSAFSLQQNFIFAKGLFANSRLCFPLPRKSHIFCAG
jgi:hypothetical protein